MTIDEFEKNLNRIDENLYLLQDDSDEPSGIMFEDNEYRRTLYVFGADGYDFDRMHSYLANEQINDLVKLINDFNNNEVIDNPFKRYTDKLAITLFCKNKAYGDSFSKSIDDYGLPVVGIRLSDKYNRIHHLITNGEFKENDESLEDTLLDNAGYSILALKYLEEHENEIS